MNVNSNEKVPVFACLVNSNNFETSLSLRTSREKDKTTSSFDKDCSVSSVTSIRDTPPGCGGLQTSCTVTNSRQQCHKECKVYTSAENVYRGTIRHALDTSGSGHIGETIVDKTGSDTSGK